MPATNSKIAPVPSKSSGKLKLEIGLLAEGMGVGVDVKVAVVVGGRGVFVARGGGGIIKMLVGWAAVGEGVVEVRVGVEKRSGSKEDPPISWGWGVIPISNSWLSCSKLFSFNWFNSYSCSNGML